MIQKSIGILLQAIPYLDKWRIYKVFTENAGLITLMSKRDVLFPFCIAEWIYRKKQSEIFSLLEGSLIDDLFALRKSYIALQTAGRIAQDLLHTQLPSKSAPALYHLAHKALQKIITFQTPWILAECFRMKLLIHEGLLSLAEECAHCHEQATALLQGESVCLKHASHSAVLFSQGEWDDLHTLAFSRKFSVLERVDFSSSLGVKIDSVFNERTD